MLLSSYAFDLGYTSLFPVLLAGGELHIVPKETYTEPETFIHYIGEQGITYIKLTPSLFHTVVQPQSFALAKGLQSLRLIVLGEKNQSERCRTVPFPLSGHPVHQSLRADGNDDRCHR